MTNELLKDLNESQRDAVLCINSPSLVIAGAGSGKTRVLTYKIAYLLEQGMRPWNILALTFTNKAAREMKERIARLVDKDSAGALWMGTFHSVFSRILRMEADYIGFTPRFTIYDQSDSRSLLKSIIKEMGLDDKTYKPSVIACHISAAKNSLVYPEAYIADRQTRMMDERAKIPLAGEIYCRYAARCRQADAMDFDDLLLYTYRLFKEHPDVCRRYAERFEFVLVDEYQDTNYAQHCIVWELTQHRQRVSVVGDDAQSIYSFRGANIDNILNFNKLYDDAKIFKLEQNYRSTQTIVEAANSLISHNRQQIPKSVFSMKERGNPISVQEAYSDIEEADIVVNKVAELHRTEAVPYDGMAVLYRTNAQSRTFEEGLRRRGIPYRIYGGLSFYQRKEIKDIIAYCRMAVNPNDEEAFKRIVNYPARGIGQTTVDKITVAAADNAVSLWAVCGSPMQYKLQVNRGTLAKLQGFADTVSTFIEDTRLLNAEEMLEKIVRDSGMGKEIFGDTSPEGMNRQENVHELLNGVKEFVAARMEEGRTEEVGLTDFLQEISLLSDLDQNASENESRVTLMTIHAAKGLEFPAVFIVGMEENLFPNQMASGSPREMEEERRLLYVALTRAERFCFLTYARSRFRYGKTEFSNPSRFLTEIDSRYLSDGKAPLRTPGRITGLKPMTGRLTLSRTMTKVGERVADTARPSASAPVASGSRASGHAAVSVGQTIEHERFGIGVVRDVTGEGENTKATVEFQNTGTKQLLLRFARFKVIG